MKFTKYLVLLLCGLMLSACDCELQKKLKLSSLFAEIHEETAVISVEVPACNDYNDSRKLSESVEDLKTKLPNVFTGAKFTQCYKKKMNSYAEFEIPVGVGKLNEQGAFDQNHDIMFFSTKAEHHKKNNLGMYVSNSFNERYLKFLKESMASDVTFNISIDLENDVATMKGNIYGIYLADIPYQKSPCTLLKNANIKHIKFGNIMNDHLIGPKKQKDYPFIDWFYDYTFEN